MKQASDTTRKLAQIKESASALGWGQKKKSLKKYPMGGRGSNLLRQFLFQSPQRIAPKLEIKNPGKEKGRYPILEFQMQNGEQLGTDPPPSLAKKKKKETGEITKKITKSETDLSKKNCWAKTRLHQARNRHTQKSIQPQGFKQKSGV